jgi:hypothetical protein
MTRLEILIILFHFTKLLLGQNLEIHNLNKNLIATIETSKCKIKIGDIKIIHPINLTRIESTIEQLN